MPPADIAIVAGIANNAFGANRATINPRRAQEAQENALVTALDIHDGGIRNKGVLTH